MRYLPTFVISNIRVLFVEARNTFVEEVTERFADVVAWPLMVDGESAARAISASRAAVRISSNLIRRTGDNASETYLSPQCQEIADSVLYGRAA